MIEQAAAEDAQRTTNHVRKQLSIDDEDSFTDVKKTLFTTPHASSGMRALEFLSRTSSSIEHVNFVCTDHILSATEIRDTDQAIYEANDRKLHTPHDYLLKWAHKDPDFKRMTEKFQTDLKTTSGAELRTLLEASFEHIVRTRHTSVELAVKCIVEMITRAARTNQNYAEMIKTHQKGAHVLMFNEAYLGVEHDEYEKIFRVDCQKRKLDIGQSNGIVNTPARQLPGIKRLTNSSEEIRVTAWSFYMVDLISYLCGPLQKDTIDMKGEMAKYFCTADPKAPHPLRMTQSDDGSIVDVHQWFLDEA